jgi:hypothetical protein
VIFSGVLRDIRAQRSLQDFDVTSMQLSEAARKRMKIRDYLRAPVLLMQRDCRLDGGLLFRRWSCWLGIYLPVPLPLRERGFHPDGYQYHDERAQPAGLAGRG